MNEWTRQAVLLAEQFHKSLQNGDSDSRHYASALVDRLQIPPSAFQDRASLARAFRDSPLSTLPEPQLAMILPSVRLAFRILDRSHDSSCLLRFLLGIPEGAVHQSQRQKWSIEESRLSRTEPIFAYAVAFELMGDLARLGKAKEVLNLSMKLLRTQVSDHERLAASIVELRSNLRAWKAPHHLFPTFLLHLADALIDANLLHECTVALQTGLDVDDEVLGDRSALTNAIENGRQPNTPLGISLGLYCRLAYALRSGHNRIAEASELMESMLHLQAPPSGLLCWERESALRVKLEDSVLVSLHPETRLQFACELAECWQRNPRRGPSIAVYLLELIMGIPPCGYDNVADLDELRTRWLALLESSLPWCVALVALADALCHNERADDAIALLRKGLALPDDMGSTGMGENLIVRDLPYWNQLSVHRAVLWALIRADRATDAVSFAESVLHIDAPAFDSRPLLCSRLRQSAIATGPQELLGAVTFVTSFANALASTDKKVQALAILESWLQLVLDDEIEVPAIPVKLLDGDARVAAIPAASRILFISSWIHAAGACHSELMNVATHAVRYASSLVKSAQGDLNRQVELRNQLHPLVCQVRGTLLELATIESANGRTVRATEIELALLSWLDQLENQSLIAHTSYPTEGFRETAQPDAWAPGQWPFADSPNTADSSPGENTPLGARNGLVGLEQRCHGEGPSEPADPSPTLKSPFSTLDENVVLVRIIVDSADRLHWWAIRRCEKSVEILNKGKSAAGALRRIEVALAQFDLDVEHAWADYSFTHEQFLNLEDRLILQNLQAFPRRQYSELLSALNRLDRTHPHLAEFGTVLAEARYERRKVYRWCIDLWRSQIEKLAMHECGQVDQGSRERRRRTRLVAISNELHCAINNDVDLSSLWCSTTDSVDWQETDVLFQVQGILYAIPLAWLEFGGEELFRRVASTSTVLSLALHQSNDVVRRRDKTRGDRRILSAHWAGSESRSGICGLRLLHDELLQMGDKYGWEIWGLGDRPVASTQNLRAALGQHSDPFSIVVLGGHGALDRSGIRLANEDLWQGHVPPGCDPGEIAQKANEVVWCGSGTDLSQIELLVLAACVIGRVTSIDVRPDVEGFVAELLAHRAGPVIAAKWTIADIETAVFVSEVVNEYLAGRSEMPERFAAARALNRARKNLLHRSSSSQKVTAHLASAFDVYGWN